MNKFPWIDVREEQPKNDKDLVLVSILVGKSGQSRSTDWWYWSAFKNDKRVTHWVYFSHPSNEVKS